MHIAISGGSGFVGQSLLPHLKAQGHQISLISRSKRTSAEAEIIPWDYRKNFLELRRLENLDALVHLAGENIAKRRWNAAQMQEIRDSRVLGTRFLVNKILELQAPPALVIAASAVGFYGDRGSEILDEHSAPGHGFLCEVAKEWEEALKPLEKRGIRVAILRLGLVVGKSGGALKKMLLPFRLGLGGALGSGKQYVSWIAIEDLIGLIDFLIKVSNPVGVWNAVSPNPVTNREFSKALGRALGRPVFMNVPAWALGLVFGKMAEEVLLASSYVEPKRALENGFKFKFTTIEDAFRNLLAE